jgi:putative DNA primase/helicase
MSGPTYAGFRTTVEADGHGMSVSRAAVIREASTITPEDIDWIWPGRLAVGALTNCVGLPDQGKSLLFTDLAARISTGAPMPPAPPIARPDDAARVLILTAEDALSYTMVPRLKQAGADLTRIDFVQMVKNIDGSTSLLTLETDIDVLDATLGARAYRLMVVDGIAGYLGTAKTHNDADVRRVLTPFVSLLDRRKVAGFSVMHPPKAVTNLAYFAGGSVAFTGLPRVALGVAVDPEDPDPISPRRFLMKLKGNLYGHVPTLAYHIKAAGPADVPSLELGSDSVTVDIAAVLDPVRESPEDRSKRKACEGWLATYLGRGPKHSADVEREAEAQGFNKRTLRRARERVVDTVKVGQPGAEQRWEWILRR